MEQHLKVPLKAARSDEAKNATNKAFKELVKKRVSEPKYQRAVKQFKREMLKQR